MRDRRAELASAFQEHRAGIYRYLLRHLRDVDRAEDLTQDVFADVAAYVATRGGAHPTRAFLFVVARRRLIDEIRVADLHARLSCRAGVASDEQQSQSQDLLAPSSGQLAEALTAALLPLPPSQRLIFGMRFLQGMDFRQIAWRLSSTEAACKAACSRARHRVRAQLSAGGMGTGDG